jgi:hypothetical protein
MSSILRRYRTKNDPDIKSRVNDFLCCRDAQVPRRFRVRRLHAKLSWAAGFR